MDGSNGGTSPSAPNTANTGETSAVSGSGPTSSANAGAVPSSFQGGASQPAQSGGLDAALEQTGQVDDNGGQSADPGQQQGPDIASEIDRIYELLGVGGQPMGFGGGPQPNAATGYPFQPQQQFQPQGQQFQPFQQPQQQPPMANQGPALPFMQQFETALGKLKETDAAVHEALAPALRDTFGQMARHFQAEMQRAVAPFQEAHRTQIIRSANSAFDTAAKGGLEAVYGKDVRSATPAQRRSRDADFRVAAQLQQAAWAAGEEMDDGEALQKAILLRQHRMTPGQAQQQMAAQMRQRQAGRTPPPGGQIPTKALTPEQEEAAAIKFVRENRAAAGV